MKKLILALFSVAILGSILIARATGLGGEGSFFYPPNADTDLVVKSITATTLDAGTALIDATAAELVIDTVSNTTPFEIKESGTTMLSYNLATSNTLSLNATADTRITFMDGGNTNWTIGNDRSPSNTFKITTGGGFGTNDRLTILQGGNIGIGTATPRSILDIDKGTGAGQVTIDGSLGGCLMIRDTDDGGWTECDTLDGVMTCSVDADGICD